jgi:hypothetical protein
MIVDDFLDITEDLSISSLGYAGLLVYRLSIWLEDSCWLRMEDEGDR